MGDTYLKHYRILPTYIDWYFDTHTNGLPPFDVGEEIRVTDEAIGATAKYHESMVIAVSNDNSERYDCLPRRVLYPLGISS